MFYLEILVMMQGLFIILMLIFLHKINQVNGQIKYITKEVTEYLNFIEEDISKETSYGETKKQKKSTMDDAQNHLIQAVLKEYFP